MDHYRSSDPLFGFPMPSALRFIALWTESLHGEGSLRDTLRAFSHLVMAEVVHLHRTNTVTRAQHSIATLDGLASEGARPLTRAHGVSLLGNTLSRAKPGSLWSLRELDHDAASQLEPRVMAWMENRRLCDAMVIPLSSAGDWLHMLEFYLPARLSLSQVRGIETIALAAAEVWNRQPEGRIARLLRPATAISERLQTRELSAHLLSESNPKGFTASELRICSLIEQGVNFADARKILGITESTLRSHMRNIFSKAGVAGQVGLIRLLLNREPVDAARRA